MGIYIQIGQQLLNRLSGDYEIMRRFVHIVCFLST